MAIRLTGRDVGNACFGLSEIEGVRGTPGPFRAHRRLRRPLVVFVAGVACCLLAFAWRQGDAAEDEKPAQRVETRESAVTEETIDPLSVNASCYVCHMMFVREEISRVHFGKKVTCIKCHGVSAAHANDENIGATKPDITYRRDQVGPMCGTCHKTHDVPADAVVARFRERKLAVVPVVCTDCHGHHRIEAPEGDAVPQGDAATEGHDDHR